MQNHVDGFAMIEHILIHAHLCTIAVKGQGLIVNRIGDKERDEIFGVLVWADIVGAARDGDAITRDPPQPGVSP